MTGRRVWFWAAQCLLLFLIGVFVWRSVAANWDTFRSLDFRLDLAPEWLLASAATVWISYALLIEVWRRIVVGWGERLPFPVAARIWTVSNLGRYLPGKVWSIAGLTVLGQRAGVSGWIAAASAGVIQVLVLGTGVAVVAATAPGAASAPVLLAGAALATGVIVTLTWPGGVRLLGRILNREIRPLPAASVALATVVTAASWVAYGAAFWMLARGVIGAHQLPLPVAIGVFSAGYITGLLALVVPGGVGVREAIFVSLLAPTLGGGGALAVGVASRLLLTATEILAALMGSLLRRDRQESSGDQR